jgi:hypothetical protein
MGWQGNWGADSPRFDAVSEYLDRETDPAKLAEAERLASWYGCGEKVGQICEFGFDPDDPWGVPRL